MKRAIQLLVILAATSASGFGALITIVNPDASYQSSTTYIDFSGIADFTDLTSITDGTMTVSWDFTQNKRTAPGGGWGTWSEVPFSQRLNTDTLPVVFNDSDSALTITLSSPATIFGFEAEPNSFSVQSITADFYMNAVLLGTISLNVDGNAGARLFAGTVDPGEFITHVIVTSSDTFASGAYRYSLATAEIPEPATFALAGSALALVGLLARRRKQ